MESTGEVAHRIALGSTSSLEKAMAPHSGTVAWKIPWMEEPGRLQSRGHEESDTTERLHFHFPLSCIGEGNGNPLQYSCHGQRSPAGNSPWGCKESDKTERLNTQHTHKVLNIGDFDSISYKSQNNQRGTFP